MVYASLYSLAAIFAKMVLDIYVFSGIPEITVTKKDSIHTNVRMSTSLIKLNLTTLILFSMLQMDPYCFLLEVMESSSQLIGFCLAGDDFTAGM